jgi:hypothetical protein
MNSLPTRIVIYAKDVMNITGRRERTARKILSRMRKHYRKEKNAFITVDEFCLFTGMKKETILGFLN